MEQLNQLKSLANGVSQVSWWHHTHDTVLFRSIRPSRVTRQVDMAEIGRLSQVTEAVAGVEKPSVKNSQIFRALRASFRPSSLDNRLKFLACHTSHADWLVVKFRPTGQTGQKSPPAELIEIVQYVFHMNLTIRYLILRL